MTCVAVLYWCICAVQTGHAAPAEHWAFVPPQRHSLPVTSNDTWPTSAIDHFVLARLDREGMQPSPPTDPVTLIRRVTLDLTGLPPAPAEVDAFLADHEVSPEEAYRRVVDRLLQSKRYAERMALIWLDLARYADTSGYQTDGPRYMWRWRDWVIEAFDQNMPFDQFTIEQLAGDMLPAATLDQRIASGFNRNHRGNAEGGVIPEEYEVEYVVDRVDTTATVWLGLTLGCARCHDHKYDPFTQKEFYQLFAYFNNVPEYGRAIKDGNSPPYIPAPTRQQQKQLVQLKQELASAEDDFQAIADQIEASQKDWENLLSSHANDAEGTGPDVPTTSAPPESELDWTIPRGLIARYKLDGDLANAVGQVEPGKFSEGAGSFVAGASGKAVECRQGLTVDAGDVAEFDYFDNFSLGAWIYPQSKSGTVVSRMVPIAQEKGYYVHLENGRIQVNLVVRWLDDSIRVETTRSLDLNKWHHVMMTYDGSRKAAGIKIFINAQEEPLVVHHDFINQTFILGSEPLRIGAGQSDFVGRIDDLTIYDRDLSAAEVEIVANAKLLDALVATPPAERTPADRTKLRAYFLSQPAPEAIRLAYDRVVTLREKQRALKEAISTVMVMQEMETPRDSFVLIRGEYDKPGEPVSPGVPAILPSLPKNVPNNRLGFAQWLVDPANPLTARVTVNRFWRMLFGTGLVKTEEDFGVQGERPSHPKLLDWLATEFIDSGWDTRHMLSVIVTSATYRQSSRVHRAQSLAGSATAATTPTELTDPENTLLARGPRVRLPAEVIRDQALAASGLLAEAVGGPSVKPYQPKDLWAELTLGAGAYQQSEGPNLYRRSMYTFWKRTIAPPTMVTFDATARESCTLRRSRTNTPLQALALMNDVTFVEASRALAQRVMSTHEDPQERITLAFRFATARRPRGDETRILLAGLDYHLDRFRQDPTLAEGLLKIGDHPVNEQHEPCELAAYTTIASLILNLDETITKE